jgi:hypothetical protein
VTSDEERHSLRRSGDAVKKDDGDTPRVTQLLNDLVQSKGARAGTSGASFSQQPDAKHGQSNFPPPRHGARAKK